VSRSLVVNLFWLDNEGDVGDAIRVSENPLPP